MDDCHIKIDSIENLFKSHCPRNKYNNLTSEDRGLVKSNKVKSTNLLQLPYKSRIQNDASQLIPIYVDDENMRENEFNLDFELKEPSPKLGKQLLIIGTEKRIDQLSKPAKFFESPSEKFFVRSFSSRCKVEDICPVCITPELSSVIVRAYVLLGVVYAHKDDMKNSQHSFSQVTIFKFSNISC